MRWSLRWTLAAFFVAAILLVTAIATGIGVLQARSDIRRSAIEQQSESGQGMANGIDFFLSSSQRSLSSTAFRIRESDLRPAVDAAAVGAELDPLIAFGQDFDSLHLVDSTGSPVVTRPTSTATPTDFEASPAFRATARDQRPALSLDPAAGPPHWIVVVPASRELPRLFFLVGVLSLNRVADILLGNLPPESQAVLLDDSGGVVAGTSPALEGAPAIRALSEDPGERIVTENALSAYPGRVLVTNSGSQVTMLQAQLVRNGIATGLGLALIVGILGVLIAARISQPLAEVRSVSRRMARGDLTVRAHESGLREVHDLAVDFNAMADALATFQTHLQDLVAQRTGELEGKRKEMELFFYGVSHDFKSPLIAIASFGQLAEEALAKKPVDRAELQQYVGRIRNATATLRRLIDELLQFARAERMAPNYTTVDAAALLQGVADEARPFAREQKIRLEAGGPRIRIETDPDRLRHVVSNLVQNAIKYMPDTQGDARVRIDWDRKNDAFTVRVSDNGAGIPEAIQADLFRPFSGHITHGARTGGAGLGLSIVKRLTDSLKGDVRFETQPGEGTQFTVRLPARRPPLAAPP